MRRGCALVTALLLLPSLALADSDGYYCMGPGFVAYEVSLTGDTPGHWLHVDNPSGLVALLSQGLRR